MPAEQDDETTLELAGPRFTDAKLRGHRKLDKVEMLGRWDTAVTDDGCRELLRARALVEISIISDRLTDYVLEVLAQWPALRSLQIHHGPKIGDDGVRLNEVRLSHTKLTDEGLIAFKGHRHLDAIHVGGCKVSNRVIGELKASRRGLTVYGP